jgi:hypothetical protein
MCQRALDHALMLCVHACTARIRRHAPMLQDVYLCSPSIAVSHFVYFAYTYHLSLKC